MEEKLTTNALNPTKTNKLIYYSANIEVKVQFQCPIKPKRGCTHTHTCTHIQSLTQP